METKGSIENKLTRAFMKIAIIAAGAAAVGLIALIIVSTRYSYALENFGFAQGDIGKAMFDFADIRSALRAAIGYDNEDAIESVLKAHQEMKIAFELDFAEVEKTIVSEDGRRTYDEIEEMLPTYWELEGRILEIGATTDRTLCKQAQDMALSELKVIYENINKKLQSLLDVKVDEGHKLSASLKAVCWILGIVMAAAIITTMFLSSAP